jgi:hypothetical protein
MSKLMKNNYRVLIMLILVMILGAATYGFAAQNTVPDGYAGEGDGAIQGYVVSNVEYELDNNNPNEFDMVLFDLNQPATEVHAAIGDGAILEWVECSPSATARDFECDLTPPAVTTTVEDADALHVAAAN